MNLTYEFAIYMLFINFVSGILFAYDKHVAKKNRRRIPEITLHIVELLGGFFTNIILMYTLRHKNRKFSYWVWTWLMMILWLIIVIYRYHYK